MLDEDDSCTVAYMGECVVCGILVMIPEDQVDVWPSIRIDPATNLPPDVNPDLTRKTPTKEALSRSVRSPLCRLCEKHIRYIQSMRENGNHE